ncbi:uncharacterized protein LOC142634891 [Castanea sativa]|uniref:uncharacterized protein LOC142634891 n=1 Tax=Castanea sativa TaxID=21020 RepID=UPI003F64C6D8
MDYLDEIAKNSNTWTRPSPMNSLDRTRTNTTTSSGSVFKLREDDNKSASMLTKEIEALKMKGSKSVSATFREDPIKVCKICHEINHATNECASLSSFLNVLEEKVHAFNLYWPINSSYSNNYNPYMRNHPYLSYKSDSVLNPPIPRNFNSPHASSSSRPSLEDALSNFIQRQSEQNQKFESMLTRLDEEDKHEEVKAMTMLRSGKEIDKSSPLVTKKSKETLVEKEKDETESLGFGEIEKCPIPPPFPQALKLPKKLDTTFEILEHLHQVKINLPLLHVVKQVPAYAKVIKDICTIKRKHHVKKTAFLTKQITNLFYILVFIPLLFWVDLLGTANALINCRNGRMQLTFGFVTLELNIFHVAKQPHEDDDCAYVNLIRAIVQEEVLEERQMVAINKGWKPCFEEPLENEKKLVH